MVVRQRPRSLLCGACMINVDSIAIPADVDRVPTEFRPNTVTPLHKTRQTMLRNFPSMTILFFCLLSTEVVGADGLVTPHPCDSSLTTLRLYFPPEASTAVHNPNGFKPEVARLYVDDSYVGDAILNLHGYIPTLRFPRSTPKIRVEMSDNRRFESKITLLGDGSTQILFVDFSKTTDQKANGADSN